MIKKYIPKRFRNLKIGTKIQKKTLEKEERIRTGTVIYIHPEYRFYTLEFSTPKGNYRESYKIK